MGTEVTFQVAVKVGAAGEVGDGSKITAIGARLEGNPRDLTYLKQQFDGRAGPLVMQREDNGQWMLYTSMFNGRTDWPEIHAEFEEMVAVLSALLSLLRYSSKRLTCNNLNWYASDNTCGWIGPLPAAVYVSQTSTDSHVIFPDQMS